MTAAVGIVGGKRGAGVAVDDDGGELRAVALACFLVVAGVRVVAVPVVPRFGVAAREQECRRDRDQPENATPQSTRGAQGCATHELPRPTFCLDHRSVRLKYAEPPATFACSNHSIEAG